MKGLGKVMFALGVMLFVVVIGVLIYANVFGMQMGFH